MKFWQLVQGMQNGEYEIGCMFTSEVGDMYINKNGNLVWADDLSNVLIVLGDDLDYEKVD